MQDTCAYCGKLYNRRYTYQKYCSADCSHDSQKFYRNREAQEKRCPICDQYFNTFRKNQKYCSDSCYRKANQLYMEKWRVEHSTPFLKLRFQVFVRDKFRCQYCGRGVKEGLILEVDHVIPVSRGGKSTLENLVTTCQDCNLGKSDILLEHGL